MSNTDTLQVHETRDKIGALPSTSVTFSQPRGTTGRLPFRLPQMALAVLAMTAPIAFYDPMAELRRSGSATQVLEARMRRRRYITISQARAIALQVLADAERERAAERIEESRLNSLRWNDEDFS